MKKFITIIVLSLLFIGGFYWFKSSYSPALSYDAQVKKHEYKINNITDEIANELSINSVSFILYTLEERKNVLKTQSLNNARSIDRNYRHLQDFLNNKCIMINIADKYDSYACPVFKQQLIGEISIIVPRNKYDDEEIFTYLRDKAKKIERIVG